jgi:predicted NUDIX family phosphoesterase
MHKIRTTMRPHEEVTISDEEYTDLERMGLILKDNTTAPVSGKEIKR